MSGTVAQVLAFVESKLGDPYVWGGTGPGAYDCSGLSQAAYAAAGVALPRTSQEQWAATRGNQVPTSQAQAGDLVFFGPSSGPTHVGIVINSSGDMIDAPNSGSVVRYDHWTSWSDVTGVTRPAGAGSAVLSSATGAVQSALGATTGAASSGGLFAGAGKLGLELALGGAGVLVVILGAKRFTGGRNV